MPRTATARLVALPHASASLGHPPALQLLPPLAAYRAPELCLRPGPLAASLLQLGLPLRPLATSARPDVPSTPRPVARPRLRPPPPSRTPAPPATFTEHPAHASFLQPKGESCTCSAVPFPARRWREEEEEEGEMKACVKAAGGRFPLVCPSTRQPLAKSFVRISRLSSQHETKSVVPCSVRVPENMAHIIEATAEHILPATKDHVIKAIDAINRGQVIAVPTDTIYGFACDACSAEAVNRIYEIKGRIQTRPLAICVADVPDISRFAVVDHLPHGLLDSLLPGPVTVVLKRGENSILERSLNPGLDSIGVRVPNFDCIRSIARGAGRALALTSANLSGQPSSVSVKDFEDLWPHCSYVFDGGILPSGRAGSTIVDLITPGVYKILRDGSSREETTAVLGKFGFVEAS